MITVTIPLSKLDSEFLSAAIDAERELERTDSPAHLQPEQREFVKLLLGTALSRLQKAIKSG